MPIISAIGRRSIRVKVLIWSIYALLTAGSLTMIYPFLLMVAGSTKSSVDSPDANIVPPFLTDNNALYRKHVEGLFNEHLLVMKNVYYSNAPSFRKLEKPAAANEHFVDAWEEFLSTVPSPSYTYSIGYIDAPVSRGVFPANLRHFKSEIIDRFSSDLDRMNLELGTNFVSWNAFVRHREEFQQRRNKVVDIPFNRLFNEFKAGRPHTERYYFSIEGFFRFQYLKSRYTSDIREYNANHGTSHENWNTVHLDRRVPSAAKPTVRSDWEEFTRSIVSLLWIRADEAAAPLYREFMQAKYGDIAGVNRNYESDYTDFESVLFPVACPFDGLAAADWEAFLQGWRDPQSGRIYALPAEMIYYDTVELSFRDFLHARYQGQLDNLNAALGTQWQDWQAVLPPQQEWHYRTFLEQTGSLRREFLTRNLVTVLEYVALYGRGIYNTVVYCTLAVLCALIVNPLAAYALSRFTPPSSYKILLFMMLTMAFPPMVTQIPAFLMMREFALLNTFWALILPGLAHGYSIFLLKGFFDSLPKELYEAAEIDGAGEARIFWQITMSLSKPILAVIALNAFTAAYSNFMMALLICQDEKMWTLMPWLYQLQQRSGEGVVYSSLIIAAIPTLLIFLFCQNIIMRGIVVPVEK